MTELDELSEQEVYAKFTNEFVDYAMGEEESVDPFYAYGPLSDSYWTFKPRILVCNLEPYDERVGKVTVDINLYEEWIKAPTGKFTAKFIVGLIKTLNQEILNETICFKDFSIQESLCSMKNVAYMNFRVSSGKIARADKKAILDDVQRFKGYIFDQINNLSPDIIIIGGVEGCNAFNLLFDSSLSYNTTAVINGKVICSVKHFSRANYVDYNNKVKDIVSCFQTNLKMKETLMS